MRRRKDGVGIAGDGRWGGGRWIAASTVSGVLGGLRDKLDALGLSRLHIQLPGEESPGAPLEGALRVSADGGRFVLETVDYGQAFRLLTMPTFVSVPARRARTAS